ncbi:hypothetical protein HK407_01g01080 [Ordospora pajunii]|uniref:uncharacterized protein n=1 Tax=Ordospora pajunii TaxID=3039483 RepID=UPI002952646C|nr:uncharacterized protein HK407_01g01080 [Ordospora pajunii]KAH9412215.1 hypothetical protein HK407_01g01080 [Ordospora pajunii]
MIGWIVENSLGMLPAVMERQMHGFPLQCTDCSGNTSTMYHNCQNECSITYIQAISAKASVVHPTSRFIVRGYQWNRGITARICFETTAACNQTYFALDTNASRIAHFTCFDTTVLYMFMDNPEAPYRAFYCCFNGCSLLRNQHIRMHELVLFQDTYLYQLEDCSSYELIINHINIKSKHNSRCNIHYNWADFDSQEHMQPGECIIQPSLDKLAYIVHGCCCVFCFKKFQTIASLAFHINRIHSGYGCTVDNESSILTKTAVCSTDEHHIQKPYAMHHKNIFYVSTGYKRNRNLHRQNTGLCLAEQNISNVCEHNNSALSHLLCKNINRTQNRDLNALMAKWNTLRIHQNTNTIMQDIEHIASHEKDNPETINFLLALYHKSIINPDELARLLYLLFQNKSNIR